MRYELRRWTDNTKTDYVVGRDETAMKCITCKSCASVLEYTLSEVKSYSGTDYGGGPDGAEWVDCPNCGHQAIIRIW